MPDPSFNGWLTKIQSKRKTALFILCVLYAVGIAGISIEATRPFFNWLTPSFLLLNCGALLLFHPWRNPTKAAAAFAGVWAVGYGVEALGVNTGFPFGAYSYGDVLGWKLFGAPLLIGVNWLLLSYASLSFTRLIYKGWLVVPLAAFLMTIMDVLIEPVAIELGYWTWKEGTPPSQNYQAWFFVSHITVLFIYSLEDARENKLGAPLLVLQAVFFLSLNLVFRLLS